MLNQMIVFRAAMTRSGEMEHPKRHKDAASLGLRLPTIAGGAMVTAGLAALIAAGVFAIAPGLAI